MLTSFQLAVFTLITCILPFPNFFSIWNYPILGGVASEWFAPVTWCPASWYSFTISFVTNSLFSKIIENRISRGIIPANFRRPTQRSRPSRLISVSAWAIYSSLVWLFFSIAKNSSAKSARCTSRIICTLAWLISSGVRGPINRSSYFAWQFETDLRAHDVTRLSRSQLDQWVSFRTFETWTKTKLRGGKLAIGRSSFSRI